jgi:hypothetical protein
MKELIEDYKRRLASITEMIELEEKSGENANIQTLERLKTKRGCYNTIITELERLGKKETNTNKNNIGYVIYNTKTAEFLGIGGNNVKNLIFAIIYADNADAESLLIMLSRKYTRDILEIKPITIELL